MRSPRDVRAKENFRVEPASGRIGIIKRDFVKPEPEGTIILMAFRITGYDRDADGSAMIRAEALMLEDDGRFEATGLEVDHIGLYDWTDIVVTEDELRALFAQARGAR
jgi:hypothetical protein